MSGTGKAIFLSYASQDAEAARQLCEALRAAGVEVWFDQSELRGGDAWDAMIRRQVKECALFVPVISANTQARREGYFRREWNLAVARTLDMADDETFLLPVVIDDVLDAAARVPEKFRSVQWTHAPGGQGAEAFARLVRQLLAGVTDTAQPAAPADASHAGPTAATTTASKQGEAPSIAVLPFVNLSRDDENEYFADGLAEELLNVLAKIRGLRVASRTSTFFFKGKDVKLATIARELNVATILEGSVRKAGNRVRITAQLILVANDSHLWSNTYDRQLDDIFAVQDDIAQSVVEELHAALLGEKPAAAAAKAREEVRASNTGRADNPEAHRLYLQGKFFLERMTAADMARAVGYFEQAVALDPDFARGWVGLCHARQMQAGYGWAPLAAGFEGARAAAQKAIALAPDLAEAHVRLGSVYLLYDWEWQAAEEEYQRAFALAAGDADVIRGLGLLAGVRGRQDEAIELLRRSVELDPLSTAAHRALGLRCVMFGRYEEGENALQTALELNPKAGLVYCFLSFAHALQGKADTALQLAEREVLPDFRLLALAFAEYSLGHVAESDAALAKLIEGHGDYAAYQIAGVYAWRGDADRAFEWLARAYRQRDPGLVHLLRDRPFNLIHDDARWRPFLRKMRFVD